MLLNLSSFISKFLKFLMITTEQNWGHSDNSQEQTKLIWRLFIWKPFPAVDDSYIYIYSYIVLKNMLQALFTLHRYHDKSHLFIQIESFIVYSSNGKIKATISQSLNVEERLNNINSKSHVGKSVTDEKSFRVLSVTAAEVQFSIKGYYTCPLASHSNNA